MGEGPVQQKALIGPEDTTRFTGGFDTKWIPRAMRVVPELKVLKKQIPSDIMKKV